MGTKEWPLIKIEHGMDENTKDPLDEENELLVGTDGWQE